MNNEERIESNQIILDHFLVRTPVLPKYKLSEDEIPFGYIYCITNKLRRKDYIGSTYSKWVGVQRPNPYTSLSKRASHYIYEYNRALVEITNGNKKTFRPIIQAMIDDGIENFIMYPIAETTRNNHIELENYFIQLYDTIKNGYNVNYAGIVTNNGRKMSINDKVIRSTGIIAINMNSESIIISQSMKLFADYIGTTKDQIKNCNRGGKSCRGWFIFYLDKDKRTNILNNNVMNDQNKRTQDRHSDKRKQFYLGLFNSVDSYIASNYSSEYFPNFKRLPDLTYKDE